jgi:hypothetical protein
MYGGQGSLAAMWVLWLVFIIGRTMVVSGSDDSEERRYIEDSKDPKNCRKAGFLRVVVPILRLLGRSFLLTHYENRTVNLTEII